MDGTMKRSRSLVIATLAVCALALGVGPVALAQPGPDPDVGSFDIFTRELPQIGGTEYDRTHFDTSQGWDWGLRAAYSCAYVEFFSAGSLAFEVHYEMVPGYPKEIEINDSATAGEPVNGTLGNCGDNIGPEASMAFDGTDHFPHGTMFTFYRDAQPIATLDYHDEMCTNGYWTPGDEPGEAWLWWDEDGPQDMMPGMGDCNGGPGEPVAIVRAYVQNRAPGVGVCVEDAMDGDMCVDRYPASPSHKRKVVLNLPRSKARGEVIVSDGFGKCASRVPVKVERSVNGEWRTVARLRTSRGGTFETGGIDEPGRYRAVARKLIKGDDICMKGASPVAHA